MMERERGNEKGKRVIWGSLSEREKIREREGEGVVASMLIELLVCRRSSYHSVRFFIDAILWRRYWFFDSTLKRCARSCRYRCYCVLVELSSHQLSCLSYLCSGNSNSERRVKSRNPVFVESWNFVFESLCVLCLCVAKKKSCSFMFLLKKCQKNEFVILFLCCIIANLLIKIVDE